MEWPRVSVLIPTFRRPEICRRTVELLQENLVYRGEIVYHIGDDDPSAGTEQALQELSNIFYHLGPGTGLGANLNALIYGTKDKILLQLDDDHHLVKALDLSRHVKVLMEDKRVGMIRLMNVGGHKYHAHLEQRYWRILWESPSHYITSNRPHLKHTRFHRVYGLYPVGLRLGRTEVHFGNQCNQIGRSRDPDRTPGVFVPLDVLTESSWKHVGESWQRKGF